MKKTQETENQPPRAGRHGLEGTAGGGGCRGFEGCLEAGGFGANGRQGEPPRIVRASIGSNALPLR